MGAVIDLHGKVALVTGGESGIGAVTAQRFAEAGAAVVIAGLQAELCRATAAALGPESSFVVADLTDTAQVAAVFAHVRSRHGRLDCAFNNAGIALAAPVHMMAPADFDRVIAINTRAVWLCLAEETRLMLDQGGGSIVCTASVLGTVGLPGYSAYCASKGAVLAMVKAVALEVAAKGVRVNAVCPSIVQTPMTQTTLGNAEAVHAAMAPFHPIGRVGEPGEIAELVLWLCSDAASFVTGAAINIDGGYTAQ